MSASKQSLWVETKSYLVGFTLAALLTAIPFELIAEHVLSRPDTLISIVVCAILQVLVHLRYFLHLDFSPKNAWFLVSITFTAIILLIMVGGSFWILLDLDRHMTPGLP